MAVCVFDGEQIHTVEVDEELQNGDGRDDGVSGRISENVVKLKHTLQRMFVPDQVRPHYVVYLKWKLFSPLLEFNSPFPMYSAIHRSFALGDNFADISAKGQTQTVVADNLGLAVAICLSQLIHRYPTIEKILPFAMYPCMASVELYAIYQQLQAVHLQTLNKERLEIVIYSWIKERRIPS